MGKRYKAGCPNVISQFGHGWGLDGGTWTMGLWVQNIALRLAMFQWVLCFGAHVAHASKPMLGRLKINNEFMTCR